MWRGLLKHCGILFQNGSSRRVSKFQLRQPLASEYKLWLGGEINPIPFAAHTTPPDAASKPIRKRAAVSAILRLHRGDGGAVPRLKGLEDLERLVASHLDYELTSELLVIQRAINVKDFWSGNVAFPGGRANAGESGLEAAVRECEEEISLKLRPETFALLGCLEDRIARGTTVSCYVFLCMDNNAVKCPFKLQASEVTHAWWVPTTQFMSEDISKLELPTQFFIERSSYTRAWGLLQKSLGVNTIKFPCYKLPPPPGEGEKEVVDLTGRDFKLWGLTFSMIKDLVQCASDGNTTVSRYSFGHPVADAFLYVFETFYYIRRWVTRQTKYLLEFAASIYKPKQK